MQDKKKETLTAEELNALVGEATKSSPDEIMKRLGTVLHVKDGYLVREYKNGRQDKIRKIHSTKVIPGSTLKVKK